MQMTHKFEYVLGVDDGQGSLACCSPWVAKSRTQLSDLTELKETLLHKLSILGKCVDFINSRFKLNISKSIIFKN